MDHEIKSPEIVFFCNSIIGRLYQWKTHRNAICGPDDLEFKLLEKSSFIFSGGSRFHNIMDRVEGKNLPAH